LTLTADPPARIDVSERGLEIGWQDDHVTRLDLAELRRRCTCAQCNERRAAGEPIWPRPGVPDILAVEDAELIGGWGISFRFNDGHEQGVYTWESLRSW
jgi:DUF971 family protein